MDLLYVYIDPVLGEVSCDEADAIRFAKLFRTEAFVQFWNEGEVQNIVRIFPESTK